MATTERILELQNRRFDELVDELELLGGDLSEVPDLEQELDALVNSGPRAICDAVRMVRNLEASIKTLKLWEQKQREKRKRKEAFVERLRSLVTESMQKRGIQKLEDPETGDKVRVQEATRFFFDEDALPDEFLKEVVRVEVDKEKLREHCKEFGPLIIKTDDGGACVAEFQKHAHCVIW